MTTYILLRNNKESAPCSIDDLKNLGLKANDMIWVEGQSVCWLNPGQIPELKNFVGLPAVLAEIPQAEPVPRYEQKWDGSEQIKTEPQAPQIKISRNYQLPPQFRKAGLYTGLIILGVIAGILIKKTGAQKDPVLSVAETKKLTNEVPLSSPAGTDTSTINMSEAPSIQPLPDPQQQQTTPISLNEIKKPLTKTESPLSQPVTMNENNSLPATEPLTEAVQKKEEEKPVKKISINEVRSQVSVKTNDYSVGSFGGIKNLKLSITNHSKYELDKVAIEIQYLKPLDEFLRSETVTVHSLSPGETKQVEVKKSSRGIKVVCKVGSIQSRDFSDDTAGL